MATRTQVSYANVTGFSSFGSSERGSARHTPSAPLNAHAAHSTPDRPTRTRPEHVTIVTPVASWPFASLNARTNERTSRANASLDSSRRAFWTSLANRPFSTDSNTAPTPPPSSRPPFATRIGTTAATRSWHARSREVYRIEMNAARESWR